jgi:hypothetical protein
MSKYMLIADPPAQPSRPRLSRTPGVRLAGPVELPAAEFTQIDTARDDRTVRRVEEPRQQLNERRVASS